MHPRTSRHKRASRLKDTEVFRRPGNKEALEEKKDKIVWIGLAITPGFSPDEKALAKDPPIDPEVNLSWLLLCSYTIHATNEVGVHVRTAHLLHGLIYLHLQAAQSPRVRVYTTSVYVILKPDIGGTLPPLPSPFMNTEGGELRGNHITSGDEIGQTDRERIRVL